MNRTTAKELGLKLARLWCDRNGWTMRQVMSSGFIYAPYIPLIVTPPVTDPMPRLRTPETEMYDAIVGVRQRGLLYESLKMHALRSRTVIMLPQSPYPVLNGVAIQPV